MFTFENPDEYKGEFLVGLKYNDSAITGLDIKREIFYLLSS